MRGRTPSEIREAIATLGDDDVRHLLFDWKGLLARDNQLEPEGDWACWLLLAGRGFGKTRTGAEWVRDQVENGFGRIALVGPTAADTRDVLVEGESGILNICPPWNKPLYEPSKRRLTWNNGAIATCYSADEPDRLRGPQHDAAWADELAAWRYPDAWEQLLFGLRLGRKPRVVVTTTPRPTPIIRALVKDPTTTITRGNTYDNQQNLAEDFINRIVKKYEGTRLGRQELYAEILDDVPGALWNRDLLEACRVQKRPELSRIVIAVDPAVTSAITSNETGLIVGGLGRADKHGYVLEDGSGIHKADKWAEMAVRLYTELQADRIVAEVNNGGDLVESTIRAVNVTIGNKSVKGKDVAYRAVHASKGKVVRAEPVSALYEQHRVHHVGMFPQLEDQMCTYTPVDFEGSPDRVDALVWLMTDLIIDSNDFGTKVARGAGSIGQRESPNRID